MEKFSVTGSYLPTAANAVAIPVITVDSKAIANSGTSTSVLDILRRTVPQFNGNTNIGSENANVGSGSTNAAVNFNDYSRLAIRLAPADFTARLNRRALAEPSPRKNSYNSQSKAGRRMQP